MVNRVQRICKAATRLGTIYRSGLAGSIVTVARIEGKIFKTIKEAEAHGLELVRQCVDERWAEL